MLWDFTYLPLKVKTLSELVSILTLRVNTFLNIRRWIMAYSEIVLGKRFRRNLLKYVHKTK